MKFLKYFLGIVVVLALVFIAMGFITPSISYESEVTVNKSAKESWAIMSDESKLPEWIEGYKKVELISGEKNAVGAVSNVYVEDNGQEMMMTETITKSIPNEVMAMTFTMDFMNMDYEVSFEEKGDQTIIRSKSKTTGNGIFAKSILSFMGSSMKSQEDKNLGNLKKLIDTNTKNYFPEEITQAEEEPTL